MQFEVKNLSLQEFKEFETQMRKQDLSIDKMMESWGILHEFFNSEKNEGEYKKLFFTYFRLYTELTWKFFSFFERDVIFNIALKKQLYPAILLEFDVLKNMVWYLYTKTIDRVDLVDSYAQIKESFLNSSFLLGTFQNNEITIKDIILEVKKLNNEKTSTLDKAAIMSKIRDVFISRGKDEIAEFYNENISRSVDQFVELCEFFIDVEGSEIESVVNYYTNIGIEEHDENISEKIKPKIEGSTIKVELPTESPVMEVKKVALSEIKLNTEMKYKKDDSGQFENVVIVLSELDKLSSEYNDSRIKELYYYNEKTGKFEWNETLLKE